MNSKKYYKQLKILKDKYRKIFNCINSENYFDNLNMRLELDKIDFEYNETTNKYYIDEVVNNINYTVIFGKVKMLNNKVRFYLYIVTEYSLILEIKKDI
jgi:hypothetical protein